MNALNDLLFALAAAGTNAERKAVLAAAPTKLREELACTLAYRELCNIPPDPLLVALDGAPDKTRAALLKAATPKERAALAEALWWRNASVEDAAMRYAGMIVQPDDATM